MTDTNFQPFSCRFREAIFDKRIQLSLTRRIRNRLWKVLDEYNFSYGVQRDPHDNWIDNSSIHEEVRRELLKAYGESGLIAYNELEERISVDTLQQFVWGAYPSQVFDVLEITYHFLEPDYQRQLQVEINGILRNEKLPWLICEGYFFQIDSQFLEDHVLNKAHDLLKTHDFQGAFDEFTEARNDLESGDYKDAILNSCKAFESVLKIITKKETLTCKSLINELKNACFYEGLPDEIHTNVWKKIFEPICLIRNQVAGHGQGKEITDVPETLARFVLHNAGSLIVFLVEHYLEINKKAEPVQSPVTFDNDLPF